MPGKPAFQLYPGDWAKDPYLSQCEPATRGIWIDLICAMYNKPDTNGVLTGTARQLSRIGRCTEDELTVAVEELQETGAGVVEYIDDKIIISCRRVTRDLEKRDYDANRQKGYRENKRVTKLSQEKNKLVTQKYEGEGEVEDEDRRIKEIDEKRERTKHHNCAYRFNEFWEVYPKKRAKQKCMSKWKSKNLDGNADQLIADVQDRLQNDARWIRGYPPDPLTYLNGDRWEDEIESVESDIKNSPMTYQQALADWNKRGSPQPMDKYYSHNEDNTWRKIL